jgi:hypothetical protein
MKKKLNVKEFYEYIEMYSDLYTATEELLDCPDLNEDSMDQETTKAIQKVRDLMNKIKCIEDGY